MVACESITRQYAHSILVAIKYAHILRSGRSPLSLGIVLGHPFSTGASPANPSNSHRPWQLGNHFGCGADSLKFMETVIDSVESTPADADIPFWFGNEDIFHVST
jgi:hypothetical protein